MKIAEEEEGREQRRRTKLVTQCVGVLEQGVVRMLTTIIGAAHFVLEKKAWAEMVSRASVNVEGEDSPTARLRSSAAIAVPALVFRQR